MTETEPHNPTIEEAAQQLSKALMRLAIAKRTSTMAQKEEREARDEMIRALDAEGMNHWSDTEGQANIRTRQITAPVIPEMLRREITPELAAHYIEERVDEKKLFNEMPVLKDKLQRVVKETRYVVFTGAGETEEP